MSNYFSKFPTVMYKGQLLRNMMVRGRINDKIKDYQTAFYPYTQKEDERIDHIAFDYYGDAHADWLIYLANDVIDPWYDTYLSGRDFENYIKKKYGTVAEARTKIVLYRNDWSSDFTTLTTAAYEALGVGMKKYWRPIIGVTGSVNSYERKKRDYKYSTNKIESMSFANTVSNTFTAGERVVISGDTDNSAFVEFANTSYFVIKHVVGDFTANANYTVTGQTSNVSITVNASSHSTLKTVIPANEQAYFSPVYAYDAEAEINEAHKNLNLIQQQYKGKMENELKRIFKK